MNTPRVEDLLSDALSWPPDERALRLDEACGGDARLRAEIESLLGAHEQAGAFMAEPSIESPVPASQEGAGTVVGRYRLLQQIGEGGFGAVYSEKAARLTLHCAVPPKCESKPLYEDRIGLRRDCW